MNKKLFSGWNDVFSFTFNQGISQKNFKLATIGLMILLFLVGMAISVIMAFVQKDDATKVSPIEVVHVIDESGMEMLYLDGFKENYGEKYPEVSFQVETGTVEEISQQIASQTPQGEEAEASQDVILHVGETENGYLMTLYIPEASTIKEGEGEEFLENVTVVMEQSKLFSSGISMEKLVLVMSGISTTMLDAGEAEKSIGEEVVGLLLPMIFVVFLFLMTYLYGQSIGNVVSVEKTSKLMEMMLTMTKPYGLIMGKIFAMACIGILQTTLWIGGLVVGFLTGHMVAKEMIYPEYSNVLLEVFELLKNQDGSMAFSMGALVMGFLTVCIGFLFYCVLAGLISSFAAKAETLTQMMGYYLIFVMIGYFAGLMIPMEGNELLSTVARIIPVTSAFVLPGDIVVGNINVLQSILYLAILLVFTIVLVIVTGKIYKNQLFYRGQSLKERFKKKKKA